jgi:hypothetical protein
MFPSATLAADHLEKYPQILGLDVRTSTETIRADYTEDKKMWTVRLEHEDGFQFTLTSSHLVVATGVDALGGQKPRIPQLPGLVRPLANGMHFKWLIFTSHRPILKGPFSTPLPFVMYTSGSENVLLTFSELVARVMISAWHSQNKGRPKSQ